MSKILIVDDDKNILELMKEVLSKEGYIVETKRCIVNIEPLEFSKFDLIILDIMLPFHDGYEIIEQLEGVVECPIIFVSAKTGEEDKVKGLMSGADDYITKPFGIKELLARVNVCLRKKEKSLEKRRLVIDSLIFDFESNEIYMEKERIPLTKTEYKICKILVQNKGKVFSKEDLYEALYDWDSDT